MNGYVDVEGMRRAAHTADSAADSMRNSANTVERVAERMAQAAQQIEDATTRIAHLLEPGYGGNGLRLIELLESAQSSIAQNVDAYIDSLQFGSDITEFEKVRIIGNIRMFADAMTQ